VLLAFPIVPTTLAKPAPSDAADAAGRDISFLLRFFFWHFYFTPFIKALITFCFISACNFLSIIDEL